MLDVNDKEFLIFLNSIFFSSENSLKIYNYLKDNDIDINDFYLVNYIKEEILTKRSYDKLIEMKNQIDNILNKVNDEINKKNIEVLTIIDKDYPNELRYIENPPSVLYMRGNLILNNPLAFVGARSHSTYGKAMVNKIIDDLKGYDFTIVSGMAFGIDALSHQRALKNNLNTVAVLGSGVDYIYPKSNRDLYNKILERGAIISELPLKTIPNKFTFPLRNRIISGLSKAVVVVEAKDRSGSLITARLAAEQGKEVLSVPGNINSIYSVGTNKLIRDGATPLIEVQDILDIYPDLVNTDEKIFNIDLDLEELEIYNLIQKGHTSVNALCIKAKKEINDTNRILTILELKGLIERLSMNEFQIIK